jgi:hypothetical protein
VICWSGRLLVSISVFFGSRCDVVQSAFFFVLSWIHALVFRDFFANPSCARRCEEASTPALLILVGLVRWVAEL